MTSALLDLAVGSGLELRGTHWLVERPEPHRGQVVLIDEGGQRECTSIRFLINHAGFESDARPAGPATRGDRQPKVLTDLTPHQQDLVALRMAHLLEVATGYRSGDPERPGPGEPRPSYDPAFTTLTQRRHAKVAELRALGFEHSRLRARPRP
ncbi:hypothetical protein [Streptosporangium sp. NPDC006930]|uniref:hypothetical protein n=1 Tax=unclassified Streptosporangium TaxID=2632669 RepID=UPI003418F3A4